ncbi:MAG: MFS transporter [Sulfobacillus acidophilus]|uniref:MFS transporter n=1 Tax=Sulfobacillus acidophilus TaxID=53633 RepID=A0A2T2WGT6_9FIRM|nr:MAG: MFS transporter [Sulfobacillus acidophilus]
MHHRVADKMSTHPISPRFFFILAIMAGATAANLYYNQPLLVLMGKTFGVPDARMGLVTTFTQAGYAIGLLAFVPLADYLERRRLVMGLLLLVSVALLAVGLSQSLAWLDISSFFVGLFTIVPQVLVPLAADLADNTNRGRVVGTVMSGLLIGILVARTFSGLIAGVWGWRTVYFIASVMMLIVLAYVFWQFPQHRSSHPAENFTSLMRSLLELVAHEPELRRVSLTGGLIFAAFSAVWTTLTFRLSGVPYHYPASTIGLFGLVGVAGALIAPVAGRLADRRDPRFAVIGALILAVVVYVLLGVASAILPLLILGIIGVDLATNSAQISNQARVYGIRPEARGRSNTVYMVCYFIGASLGSALGSLLWTELGWVGVMGLCVVFIGLAGAIHYWSYRMQPSDTNPSLR